jgi:predicted CopG family antitoxin
MLDHDDLYSNLIKKNESPEKFKDYIISLTDFCKKNNVTLLRTIGVVFSDEETRTTQYMK